jgi:hypothetical protein
MVTGIAKLVAAEEDKPSNGERGTARLGTGSGENGLSGDGDDCGIESSSGGTSLVT